ncbi:hypothetical protein [Roseiconus lacunae]|uniref:Secreted protein n=1 Tax=Roseiconus lacunae TaxID=2605694 RepID=A0ABT7PR43_9BACT|nr:hypothetical protein [Roseiconus lacunae]MCD0459079.1 hypothetical protein [Roseiconus lacunae]MDM4018963.1 hypothetical protein [Roseiconus lacunae]
MDPQVILILLLSFALAVAVLVVRHERRERLATKDLLFRTLRLIDPTGDSNETTAADHDRRAAARGRVRM